MLWNCIPYRTELLLLSCRGLSYTCCSVEEKLCCVEVTELSVVTSRKFRLTWPC